MVSKTHPKTSWKVLAFCTFVATAGALFGYDIGVISSVFEMEDFIKRFGEQAQDGTWFLSTSRQSTITSLLAAGTFFGSILQAFLADLQRFGRKGSIFFWSAVFTVGCVIQVASERSYGQFSAGRFVAGLGVGALSALIPLYNGEMAPPHLRGTLVTLYQVMITLGLFLAYGIDWATSSLEGQASWRVPVGFQLFFGVFICSGIVLMPESPRLLLGRGDREKAKRSIASLNNCSTEDPLVTEALLDLETMLALENEGGKGRWRDLFGRGHQLWRRTLNACMLQFVQQLNGQNFYYYYGPTFFAQSNTGLSSYAIQFMLGGVTFAGTIPALWLIERLGRRKMLFIGCVGEISCAMIAAFAGHFMLAPAGTPADQLTQRNIVGGQLLVAFGVLQIVFFATFWGPLPWTISSETFPLRVRAKGIAAATATNWFWNFLVGFFAAKIAAHIGPLILLIFAGVLTYGLVYIYFMIPETKGHSLEEIDEMYASGVKPWKSGSWRPASRRDLVMDQGGEDKDVVEHRE